MAATTLQTTAVPVRPPATQILVQGEDNSPFQRLGFNFLLVFIFLAFSRVFDVKFSFLHITGISYRVVFATVLLSRGFVTALNTKIGRALLGFTFCFAASVPFSIWRRGSLPVFRDG